MVYAYSGHCLFLHGNPVLIKRFIQWTIPVCKAFYGSHLCKQLTMGIQCFLPPPSKYDKVLGHRFDRANLPPCKILSQTAKLMN